MPRKKKQSFDLDEILVNSPPWPPVNSCDQRHRADDKETSTGEWVDKVMVNKLDTAREVKNPLGCWEAENGHKSDSFYQKYLLDSSKLYPEQSYDIFAASNQFDIGITDDLDELDAGTSDSSEPDLLWQFNQAKLASLANGIGSKTTQKPYSKSEKSPELR